MRFFSGASRRLLLLVLAALAVPGASACTLPPFLAREAGTDGGPPRDGFADAPSSETIESELPPEVIVADATDAPIDEMNTSPEGGIDRDAGDGGALDGGDGGGAAPLRLLWVSVTAVDSTELAAGGAALRDLRFETAARTCATPTLCASVGVRP